MAACKIPAHAALPADSHAHRDRRPPLRADVGGSLNAETRFGTIKEAGAPRFASGTRRVGMSEMLESLTHAFTHEIVEVDGLLLLSTEQARRRSDTAAVDPVAVETTMNKRYVVDLVDGALAAADRTALMNFGRAVVRVWAERIALRFPGRTVAFYLGGSEDVIVRFHVRRVGVADWADLNDRRFLNTSQIEVYLLCEGQLTRMELGVD